MTTINNTQPVQLRRMSVTDQQGKTTEFSRSAKSVNNDSTSMPKPILKTANSISDASSPKKAKHVRIITTDQKTVHLKDIKQLHNEVNSLISSIRAIFIVGETISTQHIITSNSTIFSHVNSQINKLGEKITELKNKLDSSSYKHHKSKKIDLESLDKAFKSKNGSINYLKNEMAKLQDSRPSSKELLVEEQQDKKTEQQRGYYDLSEKNAAKERRKQDYAENGYG